MDFAYDPTSPSGLVWLVNRGGCKVGNVAGTRLASGHWQVQCNRKFIRTYHIVLKLHGITVPPDKVVDHIDGNTDNNSIDNLRVVTQQVNTHNRKVKGVSWDKHRNKYVAKITINYKTVNLGRFDSFDDAHTAYLKAKRQYHPTAPERIYNV